MDQPTNGVQMDLPIQLFKPGENYSRLELVPESLKVLQQIKGPVVIVTVVGTQRGGKSTLLNLLHSRRTSGFGLGHYLDPQTTGLWIWARPHPRNPDLTVILMDTEGLDSPGIPQWYNWTLSALALLISSYFIYQTKGSIDSNAIDRLGVILKVAEQLRGEADNSTDKPNYLWLIRDHQLQMKKGPKAEMMDKLDTSARRALERCFSDADCFPLPRPVDKDELLKEVDKMSWDELRSEFKEEYVVLERQIFSAVQRERLLSGQVVTGEVIGNLIEKYALAVSTKDGILTELSQLPTQRQMVLKIAGERAVKSAVAQYNKLMKETVDSLPCPESQLATAHAKAYDGALAIFKKEALMDDKDKNEEDSEYLAEFDKQIAEWVAMSTTFGRDCAIMKKLIGGAYHKIWNENIRVSTEKCQKEIESLYEPIATKIKDGTYTTVDEYYSDVEQVKRKYNDNAAAFGIAQRDVEQSFFSQHAKDAEIVGLGSLRREFSTQLAQSKQEITQLKDMLSSYQQTLKTAIEEQGKHFETKLEQQATASAANFKEATSQLRDAIENNSKSTNEKFSTLQESVHKLEVPIALHTQSLAAIQPKIELFSTEMKEVERRFVSQVTELRTANDTFASKINEKIKENELSTQNKLEQLTESQKQKQDVLMTNVNQSITNCVNTLEEKMSALSKDMQSALEQTKSFAQESSQKVTSAMAALRSDVESQQNNADLKIQNVTKSMDELSATVTKSIQTAGQEIQSNVHSKIEQISKSVEDSLSSVKQELANVDTTFTSKIESLSTELHSALSTSNTQTEALTSSLNASVSILNQKIASADSTYSARVDKLATDSAELKSTLSQTGTNLEALKATIHGSVSGFEQKIAQINTALAAKIDATSIENAETKSMLTTVQEKIASLTESLERSTESLNQTITSLSTKHAQSEEQSASEITNLKASIAKAESQINSISAAVNEQVTALGSKIDLTMTEIEKHGKDLASFSTEVKSTQSSIQNQMSTLDTKVGSFSSVQQSITEFNAKIKTIEVEHGGLKHEVSEAMGIIHNDISQLTAFKHEVTESVSKVYTDFTKQVDVLSGKVTSQQTSLQQLINSLKQEINTQLSEYESRVSSKQNPEMVSQISTLQKSVVDTQQKLGQLSQHFEKQLTDMGAHIANSKQADQKALQGFMQDSKNLQEQMKALDQVKGSMEALWSSLGVLSGRIVEVEAKMDSGKFR